MPDVTARFADLAAAVRKRPAMYFGNRDPTLIPAVTLGVLDSVLELAPKNYKGPVEVEVQRGTVGQVITFFFAGVLNRRLTSEHTVSWLQSLDRRGPWQLACAAGASDSFELTASDGDRISRLRIVEGARFSLMAKSAHRSPFLRIRFRPNTQVFGRVMQDEISKIAGAIRDQAALRPGLFVSFRTNTVPGKLGYYYPAGLKSLLFEADYQRHSLHPGCLSFHRMTKGMSVEGHVRLVHAGVPFVWNYVNFKPTQGGAHLEGLGDALRDVFPDSTRGCRELDFVTNPDTNSRIKVPCSFIGALHFRSPRVHYGGPTKDVLIGDDVRQFVHKAASATLRRQWSHLEKERHLQMEQSYKKLNASGLMS